MVKTVAKKTQPLCYLPNGQLACYRYGVIYLYDNLQVVARYPIFKTIKEQLLSRSRLLSRLLRIGIRSAIALGDNVIMLSIANRIYEYDFAKEELSNGFDIGGNVRPLVFTEIRSIAGFTDGVVFGGYFHNSEKTPVHIYRRGSRDEWSIVYTFPEGTINHIHNIVCDGYRNCVWIFTGDFDDSAAIWKASDDFNSVECVMRGSQQYRACAAYVLPDSVIYATDTPFADNYVYQISFYDNQLINKPIFPIAGSCIYSCKWKDKYVFSTTVEPDGRKETSLKLLIDRRRGEGIKDEYVHLYIVDCNLRYKEVYKLKKDCMPFVFKFGCFIFPQGVNNNELLVFQPMATSKFDMDLLAITNY